jgi:fucose permease
MKRARTRFKPETTANPYVTVLGPKDGAAGRLSVAQAFNSVAYIIAPPFMGWLADQYHNMAICFILPLIGFIAPTIYGFAYPSLLEKSGRAAKPQPAASLVVG